MYGYMNARNIITPNFLSCVFILSYHLCTGLLSIFFPSGSPAEILYAFFVSLIRDTFPAHLIFLTVFTLLFIRRDDTLDANTEDCAIIA